MHMSARYVFRNSVCEDIFSGSSWLLASLLSDRMLHKGLHGETPFTISTLSIFTPKAVSTQCHCFTTINFHHAVSYLFRTWSSLSQFEESSVRSHEEHVSATV